MSAPPLVRRALPAVALVSCAALTVPLGAASGAPPTVPGSVSAQQRAAKSQALTVEQRLGKGDVRRLAEQRAKKVSTVRLLVLTDEGRAGSVAESVRAVGGRTTYRSDEAGFVGAVVPTSAVEALVAKPGVRAVDLDEVLRIDDPAPADVRAGLDAAVAVEGPSASTPDNNPYMPTRDTASTAFKATHPTWDGRGVTIGIMDTGVDLDHPALQTTTTGAPKVTDWITVTDPAYDQDGSWLKMDTAVTATPTFDFAGQTWTAPAAGEFRMSRFAESISTPADARGDMNRDGDTTDTWGVLYDLATNDIWVDSDQDLTFAADELMRPYVENHDIGHFGTDNPATAIAESMPFVVEFREDVGPGAGADYVNIGVVNAAHGTHVAGIAAGHGLFGGAMDGQAPGAQIVSARACVWTGGCTTYALITGMIELVTNRGVDVVNMSIGGLPTLNDGNNARAELYDRLIAANGVQIVLSAGNSGPGTNTIGDPAVATTALSVGASVTKGTWLHNYGSEVNALNGAFTFSSRGPSEAGGFKPDVIAPGSAISSVPTWQPGAPVAEAGYPLPPGYGMFNGTSMAAPQTAGVVALLLSAADQTGLVVTPRQVRDSITSSAVPLKNTSVTTQGAGLVTTGRAWQLLRKRPVTHDITVSAPVCTPLSDLLRTPGAGTGVYNRCAVGAGGQAVNQTQSYAVTLTRTSGPDASRTHQLRLVGNDGTWSVPASVPLPLNSPVTVQVSARPRTLGVHSAYLAVDDAATVGVDARVMLTTMTATDLSVAPSRKVTNAVVSRNLTRSVLVSVPPGTSALQVELGALAAGSQTRWIAIDPTGVPVESTATTACYANYSDVNACNPTSRTYLRPLPGVWELEVESRRTSPYLRNTFSLTASAVAVDFDPDPDVVASVPVGTPVERTLTMRSSLGAVTVTPVGGTLSSASLVRRTAEDGVDRQYVVDVPAGTTQLRAQIGNPSQVRADLDLFVFRCTGSCALVGQSAGATSEEVVTISNPVAARYVVLVSAFAVPGGTTEYDYEDSFTNPAFGQVTAPADPVSLAAGGSAPVVATVTANSGAGAGRALLGLVSARTSSGALVGQGRIVVLSVAGG